MAQIRNKTCIITGSAAGLGKAYAAILLENGFRVCISDVNEISGMKTLQEFKEKFGDDCVCFVHCDVTKEEEFVKLFDEAERSFGVGCIDVLVNNAGINNRLGWRKCMDVNIIGVMIGMEIAMERMHKSPTKGTIINCASLAGFDTGTSALGAAYYGSKHACVTVSRNASTDYHTTGVSVKCLCPGYANTDILNVESKYQNQFNREISQFGSLEPEEVAEAFYHLLTECKNGATMGVMKGCPWILMPDYFRPVALGILFLSLVANKITGIKVVKPIHHILCMLVFIIILFIFAGWMI